MRAFLSVLLLAFVGPLLGQAPRSNTQTVRGTILDTDTRQPLFGVAVAVVDTASPIGSTTDDQGRFTITGVPTGRIDLRIRAMGYKEQLMPNLLVVSGKELVVNVMLQSEVLEMQAVTIERQQRKGEVHNEMATLSARTISVEETSRIAGGINDPARMVGTFPGVAGDASGDNTIVVRGNSPKGVLWQLEGIAIPNPNHFSDEGSTGGPISVLNSDMLDNSDFYTGAFPAEFGNVTSAVFDMRLRDGNDQKREYTLKAGVLGTDLTAEGPLPGVEGGSYLANYRYSTLSLLDQAGIVDFQGVPNYTDGAFKVKVPAGKAGTFSLFGVGGISHIIQEDRGVEDDTLFAHADYAARMGVLGLTHTRTLGLNSYVQSSVSLSGNGSGVTYTESAVPGETPQELRESNDLRKWTLRFASTINNKISAKHQLRSGVIVSMEHYRMGVSAFDGDLDRMETRVSAQGHADLVQAFTSWRWRWNERWTLISGVHLLHYGLNDATSVEPRLGLKRNLRPGEAITFGAGLHSQTEPIMTYTALALDDGGRPYQPNTKLGLTRAAHFVLGYERVFAEDVQFKVEAYYQYLYDVPVENEPSSSFSLLNSAEWFTNKALVNSGTGRNTGVELSLEKYFTHGWYGLVTASLSDSRYKALDGEVHNTRFNMGTVANVLGGKEWQVGGKTGKDRVVSAGFRWSLTGGLYETPIDLTASIAAGEQVESTAVWSEKGDAIHKLDVVVAYRIGRPKVSHEFKADIQNVLNAQTAVAHYFDSRKGTIEEVPQLALLPVLQYTLRF